MGVCRLVLYKCVCVSLDSPAFKCVSMMCMCVCVADIYGMIIDGE